MQRLALPLTILCLAAPVWAQPNVAPPLVTTTGSAQIRVVPDLADLSFEVEVRNRDLAAARKAQADRSAKVLAVLRGAGIAEADLQTSQLTITANYTEHHMATPLVVETDQVRFFQVSQIIGVTLKDIKKVPDITAEVIAAGATGVGHAQLRTSQLRKHRDDARAKAVQAAKEKAIALALELDAKVGKPYSITEWDAHDGPIGFPRMMTQNVQAQAEPAADGSLPTFAPGVISVAANVTVAFYLE